MLKQSCVSTGCAVLAEVVFLAVARVRVIRLNPGVDGCQSGCSSIFCRLLFGRGVCGLRRCRSAICEYIGEGKQWSAHRLQFRELFSEPVANFTHSVIRAVGRPVQTESRGDCLRYHCHITLNVSVVVPVHCIVVYLCGSVFIWEGFVI